MTPSLLLLAAAAAGPPTHAVLVGSNLPGPGQEPLSHAVDDAERMARVLTELGGYDEGAVRLLADPSAEGVLEAIDELAGALDGGTLLFYYSGHARAQALDLGHDELPLTELKGRLEDAGAQLTLVVLDACQAGAMTDVKGIEPAADFSRSSVDGLDVEGFAVLASSSSTELSQESPELGGSFFTHHLVAGLRGAADDDVDGAVTLGEAYHYAYHRTLLDTAETAVGRQHVTLSTELEGRGDLVLTRPAEASALLALPDMDAEILLADAATATVVAELHLVSGDPVVMALPAGDYEALIDDGELRRCAVAVEGASELGFDHCEAVVRTELAVKGGVGSRWGVELSFGALADRDGAYTDTLLDFSFEQQGDFFGLEPQWTGAVTWASSRHLALVVSGGNLDLDSWDRELLGLEEATDRHAFSWSTWRLGVGGRASLPVWRDQLVPYAQAGLGPALARSSYTSDDGDVAERHWGYHLAGAAGLAVMPSFGGWQHAGAFLQLETSYAPALQNLIGDVHDSGGTSLSFGLRAAL